MHFFLCSCSQFFNRAQGYEHRTWNHSLLIRCALYWRSPHWLASQVGFLPPFFIYKCVWAVLMWLQCHISHIKEYIETKFLPKTNPIQSFVNLFVHCTVSPQKTMANDLVCFPFVSNWFQRIKDLPLRQSAVWSHRRTAVAQN